MPRLARLDTLGVLHHVIIRGIERRKIFKDNKDKDNFLDRLETLLPEARITCYAWALLLGGCGIGIPIGRFGEASWYDWSRGGVCCAKG